MAGPRLKRQYISDDGTHYCVGLPAWEAGLQSVTPLVCTTQSTLPRGYQRRKREIQYTDTLKENSVTVLAPTDTLWTSPIGTAIAAPESPNFGTVPGSANATLQGALGERRLDRG